MLRLAPFPPLGLAVAGSVLAGAALVQLFPALPPPMLAWAMLLAALLLACRRRDTWRVLAAFMAGLAWTCLVAHSRIQDMLPAALAGRDLVVEGRVLGLPDREEHGLRFDLVVTAGEGEASPLSGRRIRLAWYGPGPRDLEPGSRWRMQVKLKAVDGLLNPGGRDARRQAVAMGLAATGYVRQPGSARVLAAGSGVDLWRARIAARIAEVLPGESGRFVRALAVGDTRGLAPQDWEVLRATGLTHQIAISGFHVGLAGGLGAWLVRAGWWLLPALGRRSPRPQAAAAGALAFAAAYAALAGLSLPTVRTLLMIAVLMAARAFRRGNAGRDGFALALLAVLAVDPLAVLSAGFWLSFAGVGWLMWSLPGPAGGASGLGRTFLRAQLVAMVGLVPLTVWFFGQASIPGPLANLVGVPVIGLVVVPLSLAGIGLMPVSAEGAAVAWHLAGGTMQLLWTLLEQIAAWPASLAWLPEPTLPALLLGSIGAAWWLMPRRTPGRALACLLFAPLLWPAPVLPDAGSAQVRVLDVGQGLSVLVRTHRHALLYDVGAAGGRGPDRGETTVVPALHALGVHRLDAIMVSHGSPEHAGGLSSVLRAWPGTRVLGPEGWARPGMGLCEAGQHWRWDGVDFRVLHPPPLFPDLKRDSSCVLRIQAGGHVALLPGDIGEAVQARLVRIAGADLAADLLVMPRHGATGGADPDFVRRVAPRWVVASVAAGNRAGLPREDIANRWSHGGARVLTTADSGSLVFELGPAGMRASGARRQRPRYWREPPAARSGYAIGHATEDR